MIHSLQIFSYTLIINETDVIHIASPQIFHLIVYNYPAFIRLFIKMKCSSCNIIILRMQKVQGRYNYFLWMHYVTALVH